MENIQSQLNYVLDQTNNDPDKKILFIVPESAGDIFLSTSLLCSMKTIYPDFKIYFACKPQYQDILKNNPYVDKVINHLPIMENAGIMEGISEWQGLFDISIMATVLTQRHLNYWHNGLSRIAFDIRE